MDETEYKTIINQCLISLVKEYPYLYTGQKVTSKKRKGAFEIISKQINESFEENFTGEDVKKRWENLRKSFGRSLKRNMYFYLKETMMFLKPYMNSQPQFQPNWFKEEPEDDEFSGDELDDHENYNSLQDFINLKQKVPCSDANIEASKHLRHFSNNQKLFRGESYQVNEKNKDQMNGKKTFVENAYLSNLQHGLKYKRLSEETTESLCEQAKKPRDSSYFQKCMRDLNNENDENTSGSSSKLKIPNLDKFAEKKQTKKDNVEESILRAVEKNIELSQKIVSNTQAPDDTYESTVREILREIPVDRLMEFVSKVNSIINVYARKNM